MGRPAPILERPSSSGSFWAFLKYYTLQKGLSQNKLAICARMNQSRMNKIFTGQIEELQVSTLTNICLVLGLSVEESKDLLARAERAFSPASTTHQAYLELVEVYSKKEIDYKADKITLSTILDEADEFLYKRKLPRLQNVNLNR